jgi:hypothetical protein
VTGESGQPYWGHVEIVEPPIVKSGGVLSSVVLVEPGSEGEGGDSDGDSDVPSCIGLRVDYNPERDYTITFGGENLTACGWLMGGK